MIDLFLQRGRERSLGRHPWLFSGAVERVEGEPAPGETVCVRSSGGEALALAAYSPASKIRARVWTRNPEETVDATFLRGRLEAAITARRTLVPAEISDACRLVYGEADGLPGLVVDRYGEYLCVQILSAGAEFWREAIADALNELVQPQGIYERSDAEVRWLEGFEPRVGVLRGAEPGPLTIHEHGLRFRVDLRAGQKTGFYLDQRANRLRLRAYAADRDVLDCYSYTGGFTLNALAGGARSVTPIDVSADALFGLKANVELNELPLERVTLDEGNVFERLRKFRDAGRTFGLIILDPPKFAPTVASLEGATRGYKDINLLAMKLLQPGGFVFTFSCSGAMNRVRFLEMLRWAADDADVEAQIVETLSQAGDHPIALHYPESEYLKGFVVRVA